MSLDTKELWPCEVRRHLLELTHREIARREQEGWSWLHCLGWQQAREGMLSGGTSTILPVEENSI